MAAEQGYAKAQNSLGVRYAKGQGVTQDDVIDQLIAETPTQEDALVHDARFQQIFAS